MTTAEENYIKALYKLNNKGDKMVSTNKVASLLNTSAASVTDMLKRLSEKNLIHYERYKGAALTQEGSKKAKQLIRYHRLWEVFLVDKLEFSWDEVHEVAEQLEHIKSPRLIAQLDKFLEFPAYDPHGDPIPDAEGNIKSRNQVVLASLEEGQKGMLLGVRDSSKSFLQYLNSLSISLGAEFRVVQNFSYDKSKRIMLNEQTEHTFSHQVNQNLLVKLL